MAYLSNTDDDRRIMLDAIGAKSFEELVDAIPEKLRLKKPLNIQPLSEMELLSEIGELASSNRADMPCFAGGGVYDHFIPAAAKTIISRPEFMTAYTPYQAEVAQGTLQVIYEFQTHICRLTGMDVANASMYDGASAAAEAVAICAAVTKRNTIVVSETVSPLVRSVVKVFLQARGLELVTVPSNAGLTDLNKLEDALDDHTACVLMGQPNFFGLLEEADQVAELVHKVGGKFVMAVDPVAQALLKTPGDIGADITVGEGQPLGIPMSFGGPLLGFFAARKELIRNLPGRIAARTKDSEGRTGFVLTLQTREQHIRREKATSNICTNQALCATAASIYLSLMGKTGLKKVALLSAERAQRAAASLRGIEGCEMYFDAPFVREFVIKTPKPAAEVINEMIDRGVLSGIDLGRWYPSMRDGLLVAFTEKLTAEQVDRLMSGLAEVCAGRVTSQIPR